MPTIKPTQFRPPAQQSPYQIGTYRPMQNPQTKAVVGTTPLTYTTPQAPKVTTPNTVRPPQPTTPSVPPAVAAFQQFSATLPPGAIQSSNGTYTPPGSTQVPVQQTPAQMPTVQTPIPTPATPAAPQPPVQVYTPPAPGQRADQADYALWLNSPEYQQWASQITNRPVGWDALLYQDWMKNRPASVAPATPAASAPGAGGGTGGVGGTPPVAPTDPYTRQAWEQGPGAQWRRANVGLGSNLDRVADVAYSEWAAGYRDRAAAMEQQRQGSIRHQEAQYRRNFPTASDDQIRRALSGDPMALYGLQPAAPQGPPPLPAPVYDQNPPRIFSTGGVR